MFYKTKINYDEIIEWLKEYKNANDAEYKDKLQKIVVVACMPLVKMIARNLARRSSDPVEDVIQVGCVGLVKAIQCYDPKVSQNFKTYLTYMITGEIRHYLRDKVSMIKAPRELYELTYRVNKVMQDLQNSEGEEPSDCELANELDVPVNRVRAAINIDRRQLISLDQLIATTNDIEVALVDRISNDNYYTLEQLHEDKIIIDDAINKLDEELQQIIVMSFYEDMSQAHIAEELGMSQMQVSRRLKRALNTLLNVLTGENAQSKQKKSENNQEKEQEN